MNREVLVIVGPTAAGKSAVAVEAARLLGGEIVSCDSMQIYKDMRIGTAVPDEDERGGVPHHMLEVISPAEPYSVAMYQKDAFSAIEDILSRGKLPIVVGGTGLYVNSLTYRLDFTRTCADEEMRARLSGEYDADPDGVYNRLLQAEPDCSERIHKNDKKRIIRRLEIIEQGGTDKYDFMQENDDYNFYIAGITKERSVLYKDIERRVDVMLSRGLADEVRRIYNEYGKDITAFSAIGYKEFLPYFKGLQSLEETVADIKKNTRHFAKRQMTWFKRDKRVIWYDIAEHGGSLGTAKRIAENFLEKRNGY